MSIATASVYELRVHMNYLGQDCLNVWHYLGDNGLNNAAEDLARAWNSDLLGLFVVALADDVSVTALEAISLQGSDLDFTLVLPSAVGVQTGEPVAPHIAYALKINRGEKATRNGSKRIVGVTEQHLEGANISSAMLTALQAFGDAAAQPIDFLTHTFTPIIARRPDSIPAGAITYSTVSSIQALDRVSSQNSRKAY